MGVKKSQISYIEMPLAILIFSMTLGFLTYQSFDEIDFSSRDESFFDAISEDASFASKNYTRRFTNRCFKSRLCFN